MLASDQGGFFPHTWPWAALAFAAVAALVLIGETPLRVTRAQLVLVAGLAALTAWTALSPVWSSEPGTSLQETVRTPVYAAAALAFVALAAAGGTPGLVVGVACATTGIAAYSLADRAIHGVHAADQQGGLLEYPLGYANALGVLCAIGLVIVLVLAVAERRRASGAVTALCVAAAVVLFVALLRTDSDGSLVAAVSGAGVAARLRLRAALGRDHGWRRRRVACSGVRRDGVHRAGSFLGPRRLLARRLARGIPSSRRRRRRRNL